MKKANQSKNYIQLVWATALVLAGVGVFFRIPQVMPQLAQMGQSNTTVWAVRICFYLMGALLIGGGIRKIVLYIHPFGHENEPHPIDAAEKESDR
jgi:hypothetical protein